eukprot:scaffold87903_cov30-Tisochrysis_lutea.AAC.2
MASWIWLSERKASSGSACRGRSTPPASASSTTQRASSRAIAPERSTPSSSAPPLSFHQPSAREETSTSVAVGRWGSSGTVADSRAAVNETAQPIPREGGWGDGRARRGESEEERGGWEGYVASGRWRGW